MRQGFGAVIAKHIDPQPWNGDVLRSGTGSLGVD
jgi:hypothetical protein